MKTINIGGKDYTFIFDIEASLQNDYIEQIVNLSVSLVDIKGAGDLARTVADVPQTALTMFYTGLLENHGVSGDGSVRGIDDAKALLKTYIKEHKEDGKGNFFAVLNDMIECMSDDGFFDLIGLSQLIAEATGVKSEEKATVTPQDHKKKQTTKAGEK